MHSRRSSINWRHRLITSAAKVTPTTSGGSSDGWLTKVLGNFSRDAQVWHVFEARSMAPVKSRAKKFRCTTEWSWLREG